MSEITMEFRELTLMFTDIVGYSRLMGRDQAQTIAMLEDYRRILVEEIEKQQGTVIEFIGDAVFARFDGAQQGLDAAVSIQKALFAFNHFRDKSLPRLQTRIGLHRGEVASKGEAFFGDDVNIAARLEPIAVADGICVSKEVYDAVKADLNEPVLPLGVQPLKNIEHKVRAYLIRPLGITFKTRLHYISRKINQKLGAYRYPIAVSALLLFVAAFYFVPRWLVPGYDANYVEIANFQSLVNESGEADYLSSGITEALRSQLADVRNVYIVRAGKGVQAPVRLTGSVQKVGNDLRIAYQLVRRDGNVQIAGGKLDASYEDIFILQDRVVAEIATYLAQEFRLPNFRPARVSITSDVMAYDFYMRGLEYLDRPANESNMDEAIKFFTTALVHDRSFSLANAGLCQAYWKKHVYTNIVDFLERAESHCKLALQQDESSPKAAESMAIVYRETGRVDEAIAILESLLDKDAVNMQVATALADAYTTANRPTEAETLLLHAISKQPKNWEGLQGLGLLYTRTNQIEKAISAYQKALVLTPDNAIAYSNLGGCYLYLGDFDLAASAFEKSVELLPNDWGFSNSGTMYFFLGQFKKAKKMFLEAVRLAPDNYVSHVNLADTLRQFPEDAMSAKKHYQRAIKLAKESLTVSRDDVMANHYLAHAFLFLGDYVEAGAYINKAVALAPKDPNVIYLKMKLHFYQGEKAEGLEHLSKILKDGYLVSFVQTDPDLDKFRNEEDFAAIVQQHFP